MCVQCNMDAENTAAYDTGAVRVERMRLFDSLYTISYRNSSVTIKTWSTCRGILLFVIVAQGRNGVWIWNRSELMNGTNIIIETSV